MLLLDSGANADCRPEHLLEFGVLGSAYARTVLGMASPRVGLLNIGEEESKGSELARSAHELLAGSGLNFVGNVEGRDLLKNTADVVVTDGFTGNVALKLLEGCASALFTRIKAAARSGTAGQDRRAAAEAGAARPALGARPGRGGRRLPAGSARAGGHLPRQLLAAGHRQRAAVRRGGAAQGHPAGRGGRTGAGWRDAGRDAGRVAGLDVAQTPAAS